MYVFIVEVRGRVEFKQKPYQYLRKIEVLTKNGVGSHIFLSKQERKELIKYTAVGFYPGVLNHWFFIHCLSFSWEVCKQLYVI